VSTHAPQRSGWLRRDVVGDIERRANGIPVKHVVADEPDGGDANVLVIDREPDGRLRRAAREDPRTRGGRAGELPDRVASG